MNTSSIQSASKLYDIYQSQRKNQNLVEPIMGETKTDQVNISEEAKALSKSMETESHRTEKLTGEETAKRYALPDWLADMLPEAADIGGNSFEEVAENAKRYNSLSGSEQKSISNKLLTLIGHLNEVLHEKGIEGNEAYYNAIHVDKELSEEIHQAVKKRIAEGVDPLKIFWPG